jgi:hypothetical protein
VTHPAAALPVGPETVRIGARLYSLEAIDGGFILDKEFGASYAVTRGEGGFSCDCADARFRRNGLDSRGCKHIVKLREMGHIPPVNHQETPHMDMLSAYGLAPICGGSDEADMTKHTPGPWESFDSNEVVQAEDETKHVATAWNHNNIGPDEAVANARLIAAAPCLLEACLALQAAIYDTPPGDDEATSLGVDRARVIADRAVREATGIDRP